MPAGRGTGCRPGRARSPALPRARARRGARRRPTRWRGPADGTSAARPQGRAPAPFPPRRGSPKAAPGTAPPRPRAARGGPGGPRAGRLRVRSTSRVILSNERGRLTGALSKPGSEARLDRLDVRRLEPLRSLDDVERHTLTLGQGLVAVHCDRGEVDEHVVTTLALYE